MNRTIRVELEPRTRTRVLGLKGRSREWVSRVPAQTSTDSGGRKRCNIQAPIITIITITPVDMHGPTKHTLLRYQLKNVSEDESRELVKRHTWGTSLLLCTTFFTSSTDRTFRPLEGS